MYKKLHWFCISCAFQPAHYRANVLTDTVTAITRSTVVRECRKDDKRSQWEMLKFDPQLPLNPLSDRHQIWHAWLRHKYLSPRKNGLNPLRGFFSPYTRSIHPPIFATLRYPIRMFTTLFWYFQSPTTETPAWILTLKTWNDAVLRKEVPFEGYKNEISYLTEF